VHAKNPSSKPIFEIKINKTEAENWRNKKHLTNLTIE